MNRYGGWNVLAFIGFISLLLLLQSHSTLKRCIIVAWLYIETNTICTYIVWQRARVLILNAFGLEFIRKNFNTPPPVPLPPPPLTRNKYATTNPSGKHMHYHTKFIRLKWLDIDRIVYWLLAYIHSSPLSTLHELLILVWNIKLDEITLLPCVRAHASPISMLLVCARQFCVCVC